jgi:hypothetical protein
MATSSWWVHDVEADVEATKAREEKKSELAQDVVVVTEVRATDIAGVEMTFKEVKLVRAVRMAGVVR